MLPPHVTVTPNGIYRYRRRTPLELKQYIVTKEIARSLGNNQGEAMVKAIELSGSIDQAILLTKMSSIPSSVLLALLEKHNLTSIDNQSQLESTKVLSGITQLYLKQSQVTPLELANRTYFFKSLLPSLLKVILGNANPPIDDISFDIILKVRTLLSKLPNKNHSNYKSLDLVSLIQGVHKGTLAVPGNHIIAIETLNRNIKRLKSLLLFAQELGAYSGTIPKTIGVPKQGSNDRDYKAILAPQELSKVFLGVTDDNLSYVYKVLYYSGMRRSELYKCKLTEIEGVLCFDLRTSKVNLKTQSSYRAIPVHTQLMDKVTQFESIVNAIKPDRMTKVFTRVIKASLSDPDKKTMYSLRHTCATKLIANGIPAEIVSEILGHQHSTMTLNRYVKGYPIATLKSAIDSL